MTSDCGLWFGWTDPLAVIYLWRCPLVFMLTVRCQRVFGIYLRRRCCDNDMMMTGRCCVCLKWKKIDEREDERKSPGCTVFVKLTNTLRTSPSCLFWSHKTAELCHSFQFNFQFDCDDFPTTNYSNLTTTSLHFSSSFSSHLMVNFLLFLLLPLRHVCCLHEFLSFTNSYIITSVQSSQRPSSLN